MFGINDTSLLRAQTSVDAILDNLSTVHIGSFGLYASRPPKTSLVRSKKAMIYIAEPRLSCYAHPASSTMAQIMGDLYRTVISPSNA